MSDTGATRPKSPEPLHRGVFAPDALFAAWIVMIVLAVTSGYLDSAGGLCDALFGLAALAGAVIYPGRACQSGNAGIRRGLAGAFLLSLSALAMLMFAQQNSWGRSGYPEPMRILESIADGPYGGRSAAPVGWVEYADAQAYFHAALALALLGWIFASLGVRSDVRRARAALVLLVPAAILTLALVME